MTTKRRGMVLLMAGIWIILSIHTLYAKDTYRSEFALEYYTSEEAATESNIYGTAAEIYFSPVDTTNHPYAEAAFLERVGSVGMFIGHGETETEWYYYGGSVLTGIDEEIYGAALTYATPGSPIFFQAGYAKSEINCEYDSGYEYETSLEKQHLAIGFFVLDNLLIAATYSQETPESSSMDYDDISLSAKLVQENPDDTAITIGGGIQLSECYDTGFSPGEYGWGAEAEKNIIVNVYGDYYFNRKMSLGGGLSLNTGDWEPDEGKTVSINGKFFINPAFSTYAAFERRFNDYKNRADEDAVVFGLSARL